MGSRSCRTGTFGGIEKSKSRARKVRRSARYSSRDPGLWPFAGYREPSPQPDQGYGLLFPRAIGNSFRNQSASWLGEDHQLLGVIAPLLSIHEHICEQRASSTTKSADWQVRRDDASPHDGSPGVGVVTALTFRHTIDDPSRFRSASTVGAYLGLTPRRNQIWRN